MIPRVIEVKPLPQSCLWLRFHDGLEGSVDLSGELWGPMFEPLKNPEVFQQVKVDPELETVVWPNGADLAPEFPLSRGAAGLVVSFLRMEWMAAPAPNVLLPVADDCSRDRQQSARTEASIKRRWQKLD